MRAILLVLIGLVTATAMATPEQMEAFRSVLHLKESSRLFKAACMTCHTVPPEHNAFGKDVKSAVKANGQQLITLQLIQELGAKDSDGDGWPNAEEIKQDFLPGDPNSHPAGMPRGKTSHEQMMGKDMGKGAPLAFLDPILPKHSMHPLIIHFPIALFLFGTFLELLGWRRKDAGIRRAGWLCLLFGAISTAGALPTGLLAFYRVGFQWTGNALIHSILAVSATLLMTGTVLWRRRAAHESKAYFALLLLAAALVGAAGHFGALLVYGS